MKSNPQLSKDTILAGSIFFIVLLIAFLFMLVRNSALYPSIFADEYSYSLSSRLQPLSHTPLANYLFFYLYGVTNYCGDGFLACAKIINSLFFVMATPFIFLTAKRLVSINIAIWIAILSVFSPLNIFTSYFMPESMYYFIFWVMTWFILGLDSNSSKWNWFLAGGVVGIASLVKPHALFLLAPLALYLLYFKQIKGSFSYRDLIQVFSFLIVGTLIFKFSLGLLLAGNAGLTFFGGTYSQTAGDFLTATTLKSVPDADVQDAINSVQTGILESIASSPVFKLLDLWRINLQGHLLGIFLLFSLPVAILSKKISQIFKGSLSSIEGRYCVYTILILSSLVALSSLFSAFNTLSSGGEILRFHMRYYNFAFPLCLIIASTLLVNIVESNDKRNGIGITVGVIVVLILAWAIWSQMSPYQPTAIDAPEVRGLFQIKKAYVGVALLSVIIICLAMIRIKFAVKLYLFLLFPAILFLSNIGLHRNIWERSKTDTYDRAGMIVKNLLSKEEINRLVIVGDNPIELSRAAFYLDNANVLLITKKGETEFTSAMFPAGKNRVLIFDSQKMDDSIRNKIYFDGFTLAGGESILNISFSLDKWRPEGILSAEGLFLPPESWGTWSVNNKVHLVYSKPLPQKFTMEIVARAFGPNIDKNFNLRMANGQVSTFKLKAGFQNISVEVDNPSRSTSMYIEIPIPTSPKDLHLGDDDRKLGIAISSISIKW